MKGKKLLSVLLVLIMALSTVVSSVYADTTENEITVYLTVSNKGVLAKANDDTLMLNKEIKVLDEDADGQVTVEEVLIKAHEEFNALDGYSATNGFVNKLWNENSTNNLFFVNNVGIPNTVAIDKASDGDSVVASINKDNTTYSDWYTYFDISEKELITDEELTLTLKGHIGMAWTEQEKTDVVLSGIKVGEYKDGVFTEFENKVTNSEGKVTLSFSEPGIYFIGADGGVLNTVTDYNLININAAENPVYGVMDFVTYETEVAYTETDYGDGPYPEEEIKYIDFEIWQENQESYFSLKSNQVIKLSPIITPGVKITVKEKPGVEIIHNLAKVYKESDITLQGDNFPWIIADMMVYEELYPDSENVLSSEQKEVYLDKLIDNLDNVTSARDLAKNIIAVYAMGYDAENLYTKNLVKLNAVSKLTQLVDALDAGVTNIYYLPYVIMALSQKDNYAQQINSLITQAVLRKEEWQNTTYGTDSLTPMILALKKYYDKEEVNRIVDEAIFIVKQNQLETGLIDGPEGFGPASTALAIMAFSAYGIDCAQAPETGLSLVDGLVSSATESLNGFGNAFADEQGLRGLLSWRLFKDKTDRVMFDFSEKNFKEGHATWATQCPVTFSVTPYDALVTVSGVSQKAPNKYDLPEGEYTYTVSKAGYISKTENFTITEEEAQNHIPKEISVALSQNSGTSGDIEQEKEISVKVKVMVHSADECNNSYTYKNNSSRYEALVNDTVKADKGQSVYDVLIKALCDNEISYTEKGSGYISSIGSYSEKSHGENSGWMFTVNSKHQSKGCKDIALTNDATVVWFFTDNYMYETGSESFSPSKDTISPTVTAPEVVPEQKEEIFNSETFTDVNESDWFFPYVKFVFENNLFKGTDTGFEPDENMTRAMLTTVLFRLESPKGNYDASEFTDIDNNEWYSQSVNWAAKNQIISGTAEKIFSPEEDITREQLAVILFRYALYKNYGYSKSQEKLAGFKDYTDVSDYAKEAIGFAVDNKIITGRDENNIAPKETATRAEVAAMLMRFVEFVKVYED